jgi:exonuclease III
MYGSKRINGDCTSKGPSKPYVTWPMLPAILPPLDRASCSLIMFLCLLLLLRAMDVEVNPGPGTPTKSFSLVHMNIQSLYMTSVPNYPRIKLDEVISTFVVDKEVDFICMSETWLHDNIKDTQIEIPGYQTPFRKDRTDKQGGGVIAYVTDNIVAKQLTDLEPPTSDLMWIELSIQRKKVIICVGYRPPGQNIEEAATFMEDFRTSLTLVMARGAESIIIIGDLNDTCEVWDSVHVHSDLKNELFDLVNLTDMVQLVNEPTHHTTSPDGVTTSNLLDIVITDSPGYISSVDLLPPLGSHHITLYLEFAITYPRD